MDNVCSDKQGFMLCTDDCVSRTKGHKVTSSAGEKKKTSAVSLTTHGDSHLPQRQQPSYKSPEEEERS